MVGFFGWRMDGGWCEGSRRRRDTVEYSIIRTQIIRSRAWALELPLPVKSDSLSFRIPPYSRAEGVGFHSVLSPLYKRGDLARSPVILVPMTVWFIAPNQGD